MSHFRLSSLSSLERLDCPSYLSLRPAIRPTFTSVLSRTHTITRILKATLLERADTRSSPRKESGTDCFESGISKSRRHPRFIQKSLNGCNLTAIDGYHIKLSLSMLFSLCHSQGSVCYFDD